MDRDLPLKRHVSLVTGGNRGIGLGIARHLARAGADIAIVSRDGDANQQAVAELSSFGGRYRSYVCDVIDEDQVAQAVTSAVGELGPLSSVFANAGRGGQNVPYVDTSLDDWRSVIAVNLDGAFLTFRAAAKAMIAEGSGGSLVATSSVSTIHGAPRGAAYAASKGGLDALVKALAVELARHRIRANAVVPGWIEVDRTSSSYRRPEFEGPVMRRIPSRRWGSPDDVGGAAVFLASESSSYVTGTTLVIDGGYTVF